MSKATSRKFCLDFLAEKCGPLSKTNLQKILKSDRPPKNHPDHNLESIILEDLTLKQFESIQRLSRPSRQSILLGISAIHAHHKPKSGYALCESIAETVRRILDRKTVEEALMFPESNDCGLGYHEKTDTVRIVYQAVATAITRMEEVGDIGKEKGMVKMVSFKTFWNDGFLVYRNFVWSCARAQQVDYARAIHDCAKLGRAFATTKHLMRQVTVAWDTMYETGDVGKDEDDWLIEQGSELFCDNVLTYEEWYEQQGFYKDEQPKKGDENYVDHNTLLRMFRRVSKNIAAARKKQRKPQTRRKRKEKKNTLSPSKKKCFPGKSSNKKIKISNEKVPPEKMSDKEEMPNTMKPPVEVPLFHLEKCPSPGDEWIVIEIPYLPSDGGSPDPVLIDGHIFVPDGSKDVKIVVAIKVMPCFAYIMERADIRFHGQETGEVVEEIEKRCKNQDIPFTRVVPGSRHMFSMEGIKVIDSSHKTYQECFGDVQLDPVAIHSHLKETSVKADKDRGAMQVSLGISTRNFEHVAKTPEELEQALLDRPDWVGTDRDFQVLSPHIRQVADGITDFVDMAYPKPNQKLRDKLRNTLFSMRTSRRIGSYRNRFETVTISISYLDPRSLHLLRHLDSKNCKMLGYDVTAIWSCTFDDVDVDGNKVLCRLSMIFYTRSNAGNFVNKTCSYVSAFRTRIEQLVNLPHYEKAKEYENLNLAKAWEEGDFEEVTVWAEKSPSIKISCLKHPMFLDPSGWLSSFSWCITRLRKFYSLNRRQGIECCYLAAVQSSPLPYVWLTSSLLREGPDQRLDLIRKYDGNICHMFYAEMCRRSGRGSCLGGSVPRHQVCMSRHPGAESVGTKEDPKYQYTLESLKTLEEEMEALVRVVDEVANPESDITGVEAIVRIRKAAEGVAELNCLKIMPLLCFVGLLDVGTCFHRALAGTFPKDKPHGKELRRLGCKAGNDEQKFAEGINEWLKQPRQYFFHADHVLCMAQGAHDDPSKERYDPFFPDMPLLRFAEDEGSRTIQVL